MKQTKIIPWFLSVILLLLVSCNSKTIVGYGKITNKKQVAEELIGLGRVEIRTLSGGISITEAGVEEVRKFKGDEVSSDAGGPILGDDPGMLSFDQRCLEKYRRWREPASGKPTIV